MTADETQVSAKGVPAHPPGYWRGMTFTLTSGALWGSTYPVIAIALLYSNVFYISFFRAFFATITLTLVFLLEGKLKAMLPKRDFLFQVILASFLGATGFWTFLNLSVLFLNSDISSFIVALYPLLAILLATGLLREKMTKFRALGVVLGILGTYVIGLYGRGAALSGSFPAFGIATALLAALSWASYMVVSRHLTSKKWKNGREQITPEYVTFNTFLIATPFTLALGVLGGGGFSPLIASTQAVPYLIYLGVLTSAFAFLIFNTGMKLIGVSSAAINQLLFPVVAVIISYFALGELLTSWEVLGMVLIAAGIVIAQFRFRK